MSEGHPQQRAMLERRRVDRRIVRPPSHRVQSLVSDLVQPAIARPAGVLDARGYQAQLLQLLELGIDVAVGRAVVEEPHAPVDPFADVITRKLMLV